MSQKTKYAIVGAGGRATMFLNAIAGDYRQHAELVGMCDISHIRMNWHQRRLTQQYGYPDVPKYDADQFDSMIEQGQPDVVIVTTMDAVHHEYIVRAMDMGCDAISEKPMTTDAAKAKAIFDAIERTGRKLRVTFNYRYAPHSTKIRELIMSGVIGQPTAVDFSWVLDTRHGADYFRRWHANKANSGGLLVHKSTHHFDLINWWIASQPERVFAMGDLKYYGKANADARGVKADYPRYTGYAEGKNDPFALFLDQDDKLKELYLDAEKDSGYVRDQNVFREGIDIEDTMAVLTQYRNGVICNYSLIAYSPWEGFQAAVTGTKGRVEFFDQHGSHIIAGQDDDELSAQQQTAHRQKLRVCPMFGEPYDVPIEHRAGGHGGGDPILLEQLFSPDPPDDPFDRGASHLDGAASILIGISANESIATGQPIQCDDLLPLERDLVSQ